MSKPEQGFLQIPEDLVEIIIADMMPVCKLLGIAHQELLHLVLDEVRYDKMIQELIQAIDEQRQGKILEIGSGYGAMLIYARRKYQLDVTGLEPAKNEYEGRYEIAQQILGINGMSPDSIKNGVGEAIPFGDETFDVVFSFQVLEHVRSPYQVLLESWRVLKPGGILYINAPNYNTFFEGHYNVPWIPGIPKWLARQYLRLLGRNPAYLDHLNFLSPRLLRKYLEKITYRKISADFGLCDWQERMSSLRVNEYTNLKMKQLIEVGRRTKLLQVMISLGKIFGWQDTLRIALLK